MDIKVYEKGKEGSHTHRDIIRYEANINSDTLDITFVDQTTKTIKLDGVEKVLVIKPFLLYHHESGFNKKIKP